MRERKWIKSVREGGKIRKKKLPMQSFKSHAFNISCALSHSFSLQSCLILGLTPNNLILPIPFTAFPPALRHTLATFQYIQSICLAHTVLQHYMLAVHTHAAQLKHLSPPPPPPPFSSQYSSLGSMCIRLPPRYQAT